MKGIARPRYKWFKASIALGGVLGLLLFIQTLATYRYVSGNLIREAALREAERKVFSLSRGARAAGIQNLAELTPVLHELRNDTPPQLAWVRIFNINGGIVAQSGAAEGQPYSSGRLFQSLDDGQPLSEVRKTASGNVLVAVFPFRLGPPRPSASAASVLRYSNDRLPATEPGFHAWPRLAFAELAIELHGISVPFGRLRRTLIIGCSAAIALLGSMVVIGLRFGHYVRGKQYEEQLEMARRVQWDLLPASGALSDSVDFAAKCIPAWQVGGDFYDAFAAEQGGFAVVLGDVSGKGLPAALLMGVIHGAVRSTNWTGSAFDHEKSTQRLNELLCAETARERFASLVWCCFDAETGVLRYVNAGHLPPLLIHKNSSGTVELRRLEERGPVLGVLPDASYRHGEVLIAPGDLLVIASDGILEAPDAKEEEFGEERLLSAVTDMCDRSPAEVIDEVLTRVRSFVRDQPPHDDQTLMVVRWQPVGAGLGDGTDEAAAKPVACA